MVVKVRSSVVFLNWFDRLHPDWGANQSSSSGFVWRRESTTLLILATAHQIKDLYNPSYLTRIGVNVTFFDGHTKRDGLVCKVDIDKDMCLVAVEVQADIMSSAPFSFVLPALLTRGPLYRGQAIFSFHHPAMHLLSNGHVSVAPFQYTQGFIADPNQPSSVSSGEVHFVMPHIMPGSSGAPVFDASSDRVVCIVRGCSIGISPQGRFEQRLDGYSALKIIDFLRQTGFEPEN
ncbi:hypothetical protein vseg_006542 [Gypsophila vaccaria]